MEQTEILLTIQQQLTILQSTIDTLREQSRQRGDGKFLRSLENGMSVPRTPLLPR